MEKLELVRPKPELESAFLILVNEVVAEDDPAWSGWLHHTVGRFKSGGRHFSALLRVLAEEERGVGLLPGIVPQTTFWLVRDCTEIIGESRLRHSLTPKLELEGGHIGYFIVPAERRRGYGTRILALTLDKAREIGLPRVLVTCDADNIGSRRIIEKNGGMLQDEVASPESGTAVLRFWFDLAQ